jgi:acetolactate synthase-1/2/3 large subunit
MGGSIGFALPCAVGAAIAAPDRKVVALEGDGSAMYTIQALWTMAREALDVTVVIMANRAYQILRGEFAGVGAGTPGRRATDMLTLDRPTLDFVAMARGMGLEAARTDDLSEFARLFDRAMSQPGPQLIELVVG